MRYSSTMDTSEECWQAIDRGCAGLVARQAGDGGWTVDCDMGPVSTAQVLVALHLVGSLDAADAAAAGRYLESCWLGPGRGFGAYPGAQESDLDVSATVLAGLRAAGLPADHPIFVDTATVVERLGGKGALGRRLGSGDLAALFMAAVGLFPAEELLTSPSAFALPGAELALESRVNVSIPFRLLATDAIVRYLRSAHEPTAAGRGVAAFPVRSALGQVVGLGRNLVTRRLGGLARAIEGQRCIAYLSRFHNDDGSWLYGDTFHASLALMALAALGVPSTDRRFQITISFLGSRRRAVAKDGRTLIWYSIFATDVWATAFAARSLLRAGWPDVGSAVSRAVDWLIACERDGAWGFQRGNSSMPDCDCVAVVLATLGLVDASDDSRLQAAIERGRTWLVRRQNADGGWAAYQQGLPGKKPGAIMTGDREVLASDLVSCVQLFRDPPPEFGDPATEDLTARVLFGLGRTGSRATDDPIVRALAFLKTMQDTNGGWWGRWTVNYLASTAWVLRGLAAVEADLSADWVKRGVRFLCKHQNADGGWGEDVASYRDPARIGKGESTVGLTSLVVLALLESGQGDAGALESGGAFLLRNRRSDGTWPSGGELHSLFPPRLFYVLPDNENQLAVEALAGLAPRLADRTRGAPCIGEQVDPRDDQNWRHLGALGDPPADETIAALIESGEVEAVNRLVRLLVRTDLPMPGNLPEPCRRFLLEQASLPSWTDWGRIRTAEDVFFRCGFGVATALFCSSLPQCFAFPDGAQILTSTANFREAAHRRVIETAQFVFHVASRGALTPGGRGVRAIQKVRLIHAAVRFLIEQRGEWDRVGLGRPINQRQMVGTMLSFSVVVTDALRRLGFQIGQHEVDAWFHLWRVVGVLLGIPESCLPTDAAEGAARWTNSAHSTGDRPRQALPSLTRRWRSCGTGSRTKASPGCRPHSCGTWRATVAPICSACPRAIGPGSL